MSNPREPTFAMPSLWVPSTYIDAERQRRRDRQADVPQPGPPYMHITLGHEIVFGGTSSWEEIVSRLRSHSLAEILDFLTRVCLALAHHKGANGMEGQKAICVGLFGDQAAEVWRRVVRWKAIADKKDGMSHSPLLFYELQCLNLAKIALLSIQPDAEATDRTFGGLGEALLMTTDLLEVHEKTPNTDPSTVEGRKMWLQWFMANTLFHRGTSEVHALARAYDLYLTDKPQLHSDTNYLPLPELVTRATGLEPDLLWFLFFALNTFWKSIPAEQIANTSSAINLKSYFAPLTISDDEWARVLPLVARTSDAMRGDVVGLYGPGNLRRFHFVPFEKHPLVRVGEATFCLSPNLLMEKLTHGLHHLFLTNDFDRRLRDRYLSYMGSVFEDYVARLLGRVYPRISGLLVGPAELRGMIPEGKGACDFAILYGNAVILIEVKSAVFTVGTRTESSWEQYERQINDVFVDSAKQCSDTIDGIDGGALSSLGMRPESIGAYYPVVVTLDDLSMNYMLYDEIARNLREKGILQQSRARQFQALDVGELEFVELAVADGHSFKSLIEEKIATDEHRFGSFTNYWFATKKAFIQGVNKTLGDLFESVSNRALELYRERARQRGADLEAFEKSG